VGGDGGVEAGSKANTILLTTSFVFSPLILVAFSFNICLVSGNCSRYEQGFEIFRFPANRFVPLLSQEFSYHAMLDHGFKYILVIQSMASCVGAVKGRLSMYFAYHGIHSKRYASTCDTPAY